MVNTLDTVMGALALPTAVAVVYKGFLEYGRYVTVYQMMNHPITEIGGKHFPFYGFVNNKADARFWGVLIANNFIAKF